MTLFRAIAGRFPFDGHHAPTAAPPRLDALDPSLPRALADAVARALAYAPDDRFPTTRAFALALAPQLTRAPERTSALVRGAALVSALVPLALVSWVMSFRSSASEQPALREEVGEPVAAAPAGREVPVEPVEPAAEPSEEPKIGPLPEPIEEPKIGPSPGPARTKPARARRRARPEVPAVAATPASDPGPPAPAAVAAPSEEEALVSAWRAVEPALSRCYAELGSVVAVSAALEVRVGASGQVLAVRFSNPSLALMEPCVLRSLAATRFPASAAPRWLGRGFTLRPPPVSP